METWVRMLPLRQIRNSYEWARKADKKEAEKKERDGNKKRKERESEAGEPKKEPEDTPKDIILEGGLKFTGTAKPKGGRGGRGGRGGGRGFTPGGPRGGGGPRGNQGRGGANQVKGGAERAADEFDPAELSD